jgi:hypothetical protein
VQVVVVVVQTTSTLLHLGLAELAVVVMVVLAQADSQH